MNARDAVETLTTNRSIVAPLADSQQPRPEDVNS